MPISYRGGKVAGTAGQGGGSIAINSGLTGGSGAAALAGDFVVVTVAVATAARNPTISIATPSGYTPLTLQHTTASAIDISVQTCYKIMPATPDTAVTIPASGNAADGIAYTIQVFAGVDPITPMDVAATFATGSGTNNRPDGASIQPTTSGAWIVVCGGGASGTGTTLFTAAELTNFLTANGADTNDGTVGSGYTTWTSGAFDPAVFGGGSVNAANSWGCSTLALRPIVPVTHANTGALNTGGAVVVGNAAHIAIHTTTGNLGGDESILAGVASSATLRSATGVLSTDGADIVGTAERTRQHASNGVLATDGADLDGSAERIGAPVSHAASGDLENPGAEIDGLTARERLHSSSGDLISQASTLAGAASRTHAHSTVGALLAAGSIIVGDSARLGIPVSHSTSGILFGAGALINGLAEGTLHVSTEAYGLVPMPEIKRGFKHNIHGHLVTPGARVRGEAQVIRTGQNPFALLLIAG